MPQIGDIKRGTELGKVGKEPFIWRACPQCKKERWVRKWANKTGICRSCGSKRGHPLKSLASDIKRISPGIFYQWTECPQCHQFRWIRKVTNNKHKQRLCKSCAIKAFKQRKTQGIREKNSNWKGGKFTNPDGYIFVKLYDDNFFYPMTNKRGYVGEHRLIVAQQLERCLQSWERVHHKDGIKSHNTNDNLELFGNIGEHSLNHSKGYRDGFRKGYYEGRNKRIRELEARIIELSKR